MTDWNRYRELFPHLDHHIYLNHAAISPVNTRTQSAIHEFLKMRSNTNIEFWPEALEKKAYFIELIAKLIHAEVDNIALVPNTSAGLNVLTLGLNWQKGDRILLNNFEFPSNVIPFWNLKRLGVQIDFVEHRNGKILLEDILENIHPETRILSISFVEFMNGYRNELETLGQICRERNIIFCIDAIQGAGALEIDVQKWQIDFLSTGGHKWLMWPAGLGFIYVAPRIFDQVYPAQAGWMSLEVPFDFFNYRQPFAKTAQRFEQGVFNTMGIISAIRTLEMMLEIGTDRIQQKILQNTKYLIKEFEYRGLQLFTDTNERYLSGIVTFDHNNAEALFEYLKANHITVSLREGKIRVSPHFYNNEHDFGILLNAIDDFDHNKMR